jgi:hypothetical protein
MKWWTISVTNYGDFQYFGTREQAQERGRSKAQWEGGRYRLKEATAEESAEAAGHIRWRKENAYPLERWEREALASTERTGADTP